MLLSFKGSKHGSGYRGQNYVENEFRRNEDWFELAGVRVIEGSSHRGGNYSEYMTEIQGKSNLVLVGEGSNYRESTVVVFVLE